MTDPFPEVWLVFCADGVVRRTAVCATEEFAVAIANDMDAGEGSGLSAIDPCHCGGPHRAAHYQLEGVATP